MSDQAVIEPLWGYMNGQPLRIPVIGGVGEHGSGKTLFGLLIDPTNTALFDLEESSVSYNIPVKKRYNFYQEVGAKTEGRIPKPIEGFVWFRDTILSIAPGQYRVGMIDPITDIEQGMVDYIRQNPVEFGYTAAQFEKGVGLLWAAVNSYWKVFVGMLTHRFETVYFTAHMRNVWKDGRPTDRREAKGKSALEEIASIYMMLERKAPDRGPSQGKVPDVPVGKFSPAPFKIRLANTGIDPLTGGFFAKPLFPPRMEGCSPATMREYIKKGGVDYSKLTESEKIVEEPLTQDEILERQADIARNNRAAAEAELQKHESLQEAARRQAEERELRRKKIAEEEAKAVAAEAKAQEPAKKPAEEQKQQATQPAPSAQAQLVDREKTEQSIKALMKMSRFDNAQAVAKIKQFSPNASRLADMSDSELSRLNGFLVDASSMQMSGLGN